MHFKLRAGIGTSIYRGERPDPKLKVMLCSKCGHQEAVAGLACLGWDVDAALCAHCLTKHRDFLDFCSTVAKRMGEISPDLRARLPELVICIIVNLADLTPGDKEFRQLLAEEA